MSFAVDTTWPEIILRIFAKRQNEFQPLENRYYAPYNELLKYCFHSELFNFIVAPQSPLVERNEQVDFVVFLFPLDDQRHLVLLVEIKDDAWALSAGRRLKADDQMRQRYNTFRSLDYPFPRLWGLSLLGTSLRVYCYDTTSDDLAPTPEILPSPNSESAVPDDFLEGCWDIDILSQDGFVKMKQIVADILGDALAVSDGYWTVLTHV